MAAARSAARLRVLTHAAAKIRAPRPHLRHASTATVVDAGFWKSLVPKALREPRASRAGGTGGGGWNPATFFIVMFLLIGSMSIQQLTLRKQTERHARQAAVRIGLLRDVVQRIRNGEDVDVEKVLGTGDAQREADWDELLRAIERDEAPRRPQTQETPSAGSEERESRGDEHGDAEPQASKVKAAGFESFF